MADPKRNALYELTKIRVLLFWREPEAVFWVIVFPLILAIVLGFAFQSRGPATEIVGVFHTDDSVAETWIFGQETSEDFPITWKYLSSESEAMGELRMGRVAALIDLPSV